MTIARILVVDDDRLTLGACAPVLERRGHRLLIATDGAVGTATARQAHPDAIRLDAKMPAMTGFEVCQQFRADPHLKFSPIILLTALEGAGVGTMGRKLGRPPRSASRSMGSTKPSSWIRYCGGRVVRFGRELKIVRVPARLEGSVPSVSGHVNTAIEDLRDATT